MADAIPVVLVYEDELSEAVLRRLIASSGRPFLVDTAIRAFGGTEIKKSMDKFKNACHVMPHVVLTDLDQLPCPPQLLSDWGALHLPAPLLFRVAVREVESWLLADARGLADYLSVPVNRMPQSPDEVPDPKQLLLSIARRSKKKRLVEELTPPHGSRVSIGPLYNARMSAFVREQWNPEAASDASPSLARARRRIQSFMLV
jgi:hypothetical protein